MKKILGTGAALALMAGSALAADYPVKAPIPKAVPAPVWDIAIGGSIASDYNFRGISQSDRGVSPAAYFELQYNTASFGQLYVGIGALGVDFASAFGFSDPAAEVDIYAGIRRSWGPLSVDVGYIYYWYPKEIFNTDFEEVYIKAAYAVTPNFTIGANVFYAFDLLNFSAFAGGNDIRAIYTSLTAKWVTPWTHNGIGSFISGEIAYNDIERSPILHVADPSYFYYNVGVALTYKALTLDFRFHDTDMSPAECNNTLGFGAVGVAARPAQKYCSDTFIVKLSFDTLLSNIK
jgi:uncharacterized protein (TIGR02001 family)